MKNFRLLFLAKRTMAVDSGRWRSGLASFILIGCAVFLPACNKTELSTEAEQEKSRHGVRTYRVKRQSLSAQVSYRGQVISLLDHELVCQLDGGGVVQSVVEEGIQVSRGEAVVIFNNSQIQDRLDQQKIVVQETEDALEEVTEKIGNSRIENTFQEKQFQDAIQLAELKIAQYVSEDYRREYEEIRERIILARQSMKKTEQGLKWAERVSQKGYITATELESFRLDMIKNETALESIARLKQDPALYRAMIENGRTRAETYSDERQAMRWEEFLRGPVQEGYQRWCRDSFARRALRFGGRAFRARVIGRSYER